MLARLGRQVGESRVHEFLVRAKRNAPCAQVVYSPAAALRTTESQPPAPIVCAPALSSRASALVPAAVVAAGESAAPVSFHGAAALMASEDAAGSAIDLGFSFGFGTLDAQPSSTSTSLPVPAYSYISSSASASTSAFPSIASASGAAIAQPTLQAEAAAAALLNAPSATTCQVVPPSPVHSAPHSGDTRTQTHMSHAPEFHKQPPPSARVLQSPESHARNNMNNSTRAPRHLEQAAHRGNHVESGGLSHTQTRLPSRTSGPQFSSDGGSYSGNRRGGYGERAPRRQQPPSVASSRFGNGFRQGQGPAGASYAGAGGSGERERKPPPSASATEWPALAHSGDRR